MAKLKLNKNELLKSEFGGEMISVVDAWDYYLRAGNRADALSMQYRWDVYQLALKHFYGVSYAFTRENNVYGIVNETDENDWLYRVEV